MKIVVVCSYALSSAMLAEAMEKLAKERGLPIEAEHVYPEKLKDCIDECDVVLLSPQVRYHADSIKKIAEPAGVPVVAIPMEVYGHVDAEKAIELALSAQKYNREA